MADVESMSFVAIGRKYGVSDNAVRKWIWWYEHRSDGELGRAKDERGSVEEEMPDDRAA
jgi:uncharacterized protein YjcR